MPLRVGVQDPLQLTANLLGGAPDANTELNWSEYVHTLLGEAVLQDFRGQSTKDFANGNRPDSTAGLFEGD